VFLSYRDTVVKMKAGGSFETLVTVYQTKQRHIANMDIFLIVTAALTTKLLIYGNEN
jgi:hypothetical protein